MELSALEMFSLTHPQYEETLSGLWSEGWPQTAREFERLVDVFGARLVRYAYRRLGNLYDAEDVVQKVFVKAFETRERYKNIQNAGPYLYRMTANACIDWQRYRGRRNETPLNECIADTVPADRPDAGNEAASHEDQRCVEQWVNELPAKQAEVIRLRIYGELPFAAIAETLQTAEATVKSRFRYGLEKLKVKILRRREADQ